MSVGPLHASGWNWAGEPGIRLVADALVRAVVHVHKERFPIGAQRVVVHRIAVILAGDEATLGAHHAHRLVVAAVSVFQLVDFRPSGLAEELVAHADAEDGELLVLHRPADVLHRGIARVGVSGAVGDEQPVILQAVEVIVPKARG